MRSTAKVTYTDGHVDEAPLTPRGNTTMPYAQWLEEVDDIDVETPTAENPTV